MKLARVGPRGQEVPIVIASDGTALDARRETADFSAEWLAPDGLTELSAAVRAGALPQFGLTSEERFGPPITGTRKIVCIGLNYADHAAESGVDPPLEPTVFFKAANTIVGPNDEVHIPPGGEKTDWEVELAVVIGSTCRYLSDERASAAAVAGYAISNDVSERHFQLERGGQWVKGKSCETFNPLGPWLVTPDNLPDPQQLALSLSVNGKTKQSGHTSRMLFSVNHIIWYLSQFMVLDPGDIVNTGTPAGVGLGAEPPRFLQPGDTMELSIDNLGRQTQRCISAPTG